MIAALRYFIVVMWVVVLALVGVTVWTFAYGGDYWGLGFLGALLTLAFAGATSVLEVLAKDVKDG